MTTRYLKTNHWIIDWKTLTARNPISKVTATLELKKKGIFAIYKDNVHTAHWLSADLVEHYHSYIFETEILSPNRSDDETSTQQEKS